MSVFFLKNNAYEQYKFHKQAFKLLGGLDFNILIQKFFQRNENRFINFCGKGRYISVFFEK